MDKETLKSYFKTAEKPTEEQFAEWIDACWLRGEKINISDVYELVNILDNKVDKSDIDLVINEKIGLVELPVHSLCGSANITEKLEIVDVTLNRNCSSLFFLDKLDVENNLIIHICGLDEGDDMVADPISLTQFYNKTVYIFASEINKGEKVDISLALKNVE